MRTLQSTWGLDGRLYLWGEDGTAFQQAIQSGAVVSPTRHPFCCTPEVLSAALEQLEFEACGVTKLDIVLPTDSLGPLASPRLFRAHEVARHDAPHLAHWSVDALYFDTLPAISFVTSIPDQPFEGFVVDESLRFWIEASKLTLDLLTRGRFLPVLKKEDGGYHARWQFIPSEEHDQQRFAVLAESMPPLCRALPLTEPDSFQEPAALLESFMELTTDALIRLFLKHSELAALEQEPSSRPHTLQRSWLRSLVSAEGSVEGSSAELSNFEDRLKRWSGSLIPTSGRQELRVAFVLYPPKRNELPDAPWRVEIAIKAAADNARQLTAAELWQGSLGFLQHADYTTDDLEDFLLAELGRASSVFPELNKALVQQFPTDVSLSTENSYRFLRETAVLLEQSGFAVLLPSWWKKPSSHVGLHLHLEPSRTSPGPGGQGESALGLSHLLDYSWNIAIGENVISTDEFRELVHKNVPLVQVNDQWIELNPEKMRATLSFLEREQHKRRLTVLEALRMGIGLDLDDVVLPVVSMSARGWIEKLFEGQHEHVELIDQPTNFTGTLRHYQREGLSWLAFLARIGIGACLADDMGLGKTIQLLALLVHERNLQPDARLQPTLLIVPMSILDNWTREAERFAPSLKTYLHHGSSRLTEREFLPMAQKVDLVVTTYSLAFRDEELFRKVHWGRIALDEAQNIKNASTKQSRAIKRLTNEQHALDDRRTVLQRVVLTGTPLENHLDELWSIFDFLNPGLLGSRKDFKSRFSVPIERYRDTAAQELLTKLIRPFVLRRLKKDPKVISDLPEKIEMDVFTSLSAEQAALYQSVVESMMPQVDKASGIHRKGLVLSTITKLKQICNHPELYLKSDGALAHRSGKLSRLDELLEVILAEGDKVLIFTQYAQMGQLLQRHLEERFRQETLFLHGSLSKSAREKIIDRFQRQEGPALFVLSLKAGGFGLNLTQANQVIHFDQWWNPAVEEQATDRAYRIGQQRNVQVRRFICKGTLEERIAEMTRRKRELADSIVGSARNDITQLTTSELKSLLSLSVQLSTEMESDDEVA